MKEKDIVKYESYFSKEELLVKLKSCAKNVGKKLLHYVLSLYYALWDGALSIKEKSLIIGALGYFILPIDIVPDFMLPIGYADDLSLLTVVFTKLHGAITPEIEYKAKLKAEELLGDDTQSVY